ncbi:MAG: stage III sporulation protein AB [Acetatifactor sp.]
MLKGIACCMIIAGSLGMGVWYKNEFTGRIRAIRMLRTILILLEGEIRYGRDTLSECCGHIAIRLKGECQTAFEQVAERMRQNGGESFERIFRSSVEPALKGLPLKQEDIEDFFRFVGTYGFADSSLQLRLLEQSREQLEARAEELSAGNGERCRMAVSLGAMGGFLIILVLW